jgi:hypothetical protein
MPVQRLTLTKKPQISTALNLLSKEEKEMIHYKNAKSFLGIKY